MDSTPRGYPYPECNPPWTQDASDIIHLRNLAVAVDTDVQAVYDRAADTVVRPAAARMSTASSVADTSNTAFPVFTLRTFDTTEGNAMTDTTEGVIRLLRPGWYQVGAYAVLTPSPVATAMAPRIRFLQNGTLATSFGTYGERAQADQQIAQITADLYTATGGDTLTIEIRNGAATPDYTYTARIWASQGVML